MFATIEDLVALGSKKLESTQKTNEEIEELIEAVEKLMDRTKVMYEQYFLGIQKMPPNQLHKDVDRRLRDLAQDQIRNTGLRFRFLTLQQKLGSYNSYWKRVMRQIEQGTYMRDVARVSRKAASLGEAVPEELLAKMPKRFADKIRRERAQMEEIAARLKQGKPAIARPGEKSVAAAAAAAAPPAAARASTSELADVGEDELDSMFDNLTRSEPSPLAAAAASPPAASPPAAPRSTSPPAASPPAAPRSTSPPAATRPATSTPPPVPTAAKRPATSTPPPVPPRAPTAPPPRAAAAPIAAATPPGMDEKQCRDLYARYVRARELVGQSTADLSYEKLVGSLNKQAPSIMKEHGARGVEFNVVVKGDKVILKAKPQK
jgi:hypothetical protein